MRLTLKNEKRRTERSLNVSASGELSSRQVRQAFDELCGLPGQLHAGHLGQWPVVQTPPETVSEEHPEGVPYIAIERPRCKSCSEPWPHELNERGEARFTADHCCRCGRSKRETLHALVPLEAVRSLITAAPGGAAEL